MYICQQRLINKFACIPEQLPNYFVPFSDSKPFFHRGLIYYRHQDQISLIAYPLSPNPSSLPLGMHVQHLTRKLKPGELKIISPVDLGIDSYKQTRRETDHYYCLELKKINIGVKLRNMLNRAAREVYPAVAREFTREHLKILTGFLRFKGLDREKVLFFHRIPEYLAESDTAFIIETRKLKTHELVAYDILDSSSGGYAFYLFNITGSESRKIPGINDLMLREAIQAALDRGSIYMNMGLGINKGVIAFKAKWGAFPFLSYNFYHFSRKFSWKKIFRAG